jgi:hypothetical protein
LITTHLSAGSHDLIDQQELLSQNWAYIDELSLDTEIVIDALHLGLDHSFFNAIKSNGDLLLLVSIK